MTASAIQGDREKCLESGMNDYLAKPVRVHLLKKKVEYYMLRTPKPMPILQEVNELAGDVLEQNGSEVHTPNEQKVAHTRKKSGTFSTNGMFDAPEKPMTAMRVVDSDDNLELSPTGLTYRTHGGQMEPVTNRLFNGTQNLENQHLALPKPHTTIDLDSQRVDKS
jgi:hypothetical protein